MNIIRVGIPKIPGMMLIPFALAKGYYKSEGLEVVVSYDEQAIEKAIPLFAEGKFDIFGASNTIYAGSPDLFEHGKWALTLYHSEGGMAIVARKGLNSLWDARGKKFSTVVGSKFTIAWILKKYALTLADITITEDPLPDIAGIIERGEADFGYVAAPYYEKMQAGGHSVVFNSKEEPGLVTLGLVFHDGFIATRRDDALGFLRVYAKALEAIRKDPAEFIDYVSSEMKAPVEMLTKMFQENIKLLDLNENQKMLMGDMPSLMNIKLNLRYISLFLAGQGQVHTVDPEKGVFGSLVSELIEGQIAKNNLDTNDSAQG